MSEVTLNLNDGPWLAAVARLIATSKREASVVLRAEMKQVVRLLVDITPPGSQGVKGAAAKKQGEGAIVRDIRSIYGTPSDARTGIDVVSKPKADLFWKLQKKGQVEEEKAVMRDAGITRSFAPFDGGAIHQRMKNKRGRGRSRSLIMFVTDPESLTLYIKDVQKNVFFLAAGWEEAAQQLGLTLPEMISRHDSPGKLEVITTQDLIKIRATNSVKYASQAADMNRRIQWVMDTRKEVLDRAWKKYIEKQAAKAKL